MSEAIRDTMIVVFNAAENDWARQFARSIIRATHKADWTPSDKQAAMIQRYKSELRQAEEYDGFDLFEQTGNTGHIDTEAA